MGRFHHYAASEYCRARPDARIRIGVLGDVADDGDGIRAGGEDVGRVFELDAADGDQRNVADAIFHAVMRSMPCGAKRIAFRVVKKIGPSAM